MQAGCIVTLNVERHDGNSIRLKCPMLGLLKLRLKQLTLLTILPSSRSLDSESLMTAVGWRGAPPWGDLTALASPGNQPQGLYPTTAA